MDSLIYFFLLLIEIYGSPTSYVMVPTLDLVGLTLYFNK